MDVHLDTDFLIYALEAGGPERRRARELVESEHEIGISSIVWYEFSRDPRTPEQLATARALFAEDGVVPFSETIVVSAAEVFRQLGSPRRRAADIAIGVTAALFGVTLVTRNARDFAGIPGLELEDVHASTR